MATISPSDSGARFVGREPDVKCHQGSAADASGAPKASAIAERRGTTVTTIIRRIYLPLPIDRLALAFFAFFFTHLPCCLTEPFLHLTGFDFGFAFAPTTAKSGLLGP